jgi:hypothetical protein
MAGGTPSILMQGGRVGTWYTYNDGSATGTQTPAMSTACDPVVIAGGYCGFTRAQNTFGSGFTTWGAGIGFDLDNTGVGSRKPYNASAFTGIAFLAHGSNQVRFNVTESATIPTAQGGTCTTNCSDAHGTEISLTAAWVQYVVPFSTLAQVGWGTKAAFDPATILSVQFQVVQNTSFDFYIGDIGFY